MNNTVLNDKMTELESACKDNDHELVKSVLGSLETPELKSKGFKKIIAYYKESAAAPVGYMMFYAQWLISQDDLSEAMKLLREIRQLGVDDERISAFIYNSLIKPREAEFSARYHRNMELLKTNGVLFNDSDISFNVITKKLLVISEYQSSVPDSMIDCFEMSIPQMLVDIISVKTILYALSKTEMLYLVYDDMQYLYYMLLFEDLNQFLSFISKKRILMFEGKAKGLMEKFFLNILVRPPQYSLEHSVNAGYVEFITRINEARKDSYNELKGVLDDYYASYDQEYYRKLFQGNVSEIKVLLITSRHTELNKFIVKHWYKAFLDLGYRAELLIEREQFEIVNEYSVHWKINEYRPDIIFHINFGASSLNKGNLRNNILWINRYRDKAGNDLHKISSNYNYHNMFILPVLAEWEERLKRIDIPPERILTTSEGVDISIFTKSKNINSEYACDLTCVSNSVGSKDQKIEHYFRMISTPVLKELVLKEMISLNELLDDEKLIFVLPVCTDVLDTILNRIDQKLSYQSGNEMSDHDRRVLRDFFEHMIDMVCRTRIMEWVVDSGITRNIKLWGRYWSNNEKFAPYHMGTASYGGQLASIYRSSNISLSDNPWALHERNFEIIASGGFPMIRSVDMGAAEEKQRITNFFKEDKEIVLFHSRDDFLNKFQYYLDNPELRMEVAEKGRGVVHRDFTCEAIADKTMKFVRSLYE
ncbi:MAG: glycosyltransferase family 1 protein [Nitrospira sp.]|nr:glycosyltransferase family 1 protein [Nitrospira sp.]